MKNVVYVVLVLIVAIAGYNFLNKPAVNVETITETEEATSSVDNVNSDENSDSVNMHTPADMSEEAQAEMYDFIMEYNQCMMKGRLEATTQPQQVQQAANDILMKCDEVLEQLKTHLLANDVNESLVIGMTHKMRSRGARNLMTKAMNNMAAQAAAVENAEQMNAQTVPAE